MNDAQTEGVAVLHTAIHCLTAIARHHGVDRAPTQLIHEHALVAEPDQRQLQHIAEAVGLQAKAVSLDWEAFSRLSPVCPVIARLNNGNSVVVVAIRPPTDGAGAGVVIFDPLEGVDNTTRTVTQDRFTERWTGEILLLQRRYRLTDADQPFGLRWFIPEILGQRTAVIDVILAALFLHGLALVVPIFFQLIIDKVLTHESYSTLNVLGIGVLIAVLFDALLGFLRSYLLLHATTKIDIRVATRTFGHLLALPAVFFERNTAGVLSKHMQQTATIREFLTGRLLLTLLDASVLVVFIPVLLFYSTRLTLVVLGFSVAMAALIGALITPYRHRLQGLYRAEGERQAHLVETIHGMATIKALALEPRQRRHWDGIAAHAIAQHFEVGEISTVARTLSSLLEKAMTIAVVWLGALAVFDHMMTVGELVAFQMLAGRVSGPLVQLVGLIHQYEEAALSVRMLGEVMNRPAERNLRHGLQPVLGGDIEFDQVRFSYPDTPLPALDGISLRIPAGAMVGVVGPSGSGKSTFIRLIQGLYPVQSGLIRLNGTDIREIDLTHLRRHIGTVPQDAFLFRGAVRDNLSVTKPDATFAEIVTAARLAGADEFIQRLPKGYDTELEEGASNLSGGQKQRLSIARALLRQPPLLLLDEATSALDPDSEAIVVDNLEKIAQGRTTIIVSHRLTTIANADIIFVFNAGKIADFGPHRQLLQRCEIYRHLWAQQTRNLA